MIFRRKPTRRDELVASVVRAFRAESLHRASDLMSCHPDLYFALARLSAHDVLTRDTSPAAGAGGEGK